MKIKWLPGDTITVLHDAGMFQDRYPTSISFSNDYISAIRCAFDALKAGKHNVRIVQFRDVIHTHFQLQSALDILNEFSTDEEILEATHHASRNPSGVREHNSLRHLLRSGQHSNRNSSALVWAQI